MSTVADRTATTVFSSSETTRRWSRRAAGLHQCLYGRYSCVETRWTHVSHDKSVLACRDEPLPVRKPSYGRDKVIMAILTREGERTPPCPRLREHKGNRSTTPYRTIVEYRCSSFRTHGHCRPDLNNILSRRKKVTVVRRPSEVPDGLSVPVELMVNDAASTVWVLSLSRRDAGQTSHSM